MSRTCIICGNPAGSGEHVFPAALGGRRRNNSIYCDVHNNAYSDLVSELSGQLEGFNAMLGVRPDRKADARATVVMDVATGKAMKFSVKKIGFVEPRVLSDETLADGSRKLEVAF